MQMDEVKCKSLPRSKNGERALPRPDGTGRLQWAMGSGQQGRPSATAFTAATGWAGKWQRRVPGERWALDGPRPITGGKNYASTP